VAFTNEVIEEIIASAEERACCERAEFAAFVHFSGYLRIGHDQPTLVLRVARPVSARRAVALARRVLGLEVGPITRYESAFEKWYEVELYADDLLAKLSRIGIAGFVTPTEESLSRDLLTSKCCRQGYLRGLFLSTGYILKPEKGRNVEFHLNSEEAAREASRLLKKFGLTPHETKRRHRYIVYLKSYDDVKAVLYNLGAKSAHFAFEDIQVVREIKNTVNRLVNSELANLQKTARSAARQLRAIDTIEKTIGLDALPPALREMALLRRGHPDATLDELAGLLGGGHTKSAVSHRIRRLEKIASELGDRHQHSGEGTEWQ